MFDLKKAKKDSGIRKDTLILLEKKIREEFKGDEMMFELHFIRTLEAIKEGWISLEEALSESLEIPKTRKVKEWKTK